MKLQDQVITLEQAKRLSQLGLRQGLSSFFWDDYDGKQQLMMNETPEDGYEPDEKNTCFSAFTVAELMTILPPTVTIKDKKGVLRVDKEDECEYYGYPESYLVGYYSSDKEPVKEWLMGSGMESLAQSAAGILIMLLEHGHLTSEQVKARLCPAL